MYEEVTYWTEKAQQAEIERGVALVAAFGLVPYKDGNQWCYLLGEDLQSGIAGFGETAFSAAVNFESKYCFETIREKQ